jgi:DNA-binding MarR family transcriptional regulator
MSQAAWHRATSPNEGDHGVLAPDPVDRRSSLVRLIDTGRDVIDEATTQHVLTEQRLVTGLDEEERAQRRVLLRKLLRAVDRG